MYLFLVTEKLPVLHYLSLEGGSLAKINYQEGKKRKKHTHTKKNLSRRFSKYNHLLNLLILFFLYMELFFSYFILSDWDCWVIFESSHLRTVCQAFEHFLSTICGRALGFDPVTTLDVLTLGHTFIYCRLDNCDSSLASCSDTTIKRFC